MKIGRIGRIGLTSHKSYASYASYSSYFPKGANLAGNKTYIAFLHLSRGGGGYGVAARG